MKNADSAVIDIPATTGAGASKKKAAVLATPPKDKPAGSGVNRGFAIFDFVLRLGALGAALGAAAAMGTSDETLPFFTQFFQFEASYDDLPTFQFFVVAMGIVSGYVVLSLPFSIVCIIRPLAAGPRLLLIILDAVVLTLATGSAGAAAAVVYVAHSGNSSTNWLSICNQFGDFCQQASGAVVGSFIAVVLLVLLVVFSALALRNTR